MGYVLTQDCFCFLVQPLQTGIAFASYNSTSACLLLNYWANFTTKGASVSNCKTSYICKYILTGSIVIIIIRIFLRSLNLSNKFEYLPHLLSFISYSDKICLPRGLCRVRYHKIFGCNSTCKFHWSIFPGS